MEQQPRKRFKDLTVEEKRQYQREAKQRARAKQKAARYTPTANEASASFAANHPERVKELDEYAKDFAAKVSGELSQPGTIDEQVIDRVARCLLGLKRGWVQEVTSPDGELVSGMCFADASGDMVESANRYNLKQSPTFAALYCELLTLIDRRYGGQPSKDAAIIRAELTGTYVLPPPPERQSGMSSNQRV